MATLIFHWFSGAPAALLRYAGNERFTVFFKKKTEQNVSLF